MDDELLQDFLVEAGEILELLNEQLVDLENRPDDSELLNSIFRGFHTIKGGAGFLGVDQMVIVCHRTEDIFNLLRNGELHVDAALMDTVLPVLDVVNAQFDALRSGDEPPAADDGLLEALQRYASGEMANTVQQEDDAEGAVEIAEEYTAESSDDDFDISAEASDTSDSDIQITDEEFQDLLNVLENPNASLPSATTKPASTSSDEISEEEFDALLDNLHGKGKFSNAPKAGSSPGAKPAGDDITDDEFEALLDNLHGEGKFNATAKKEQAAQKPPAGKKGGDDEITDDEFDALLDDLHGKGKFSGAVNKPADSVSQNKKSPAGKGKHDEITDDEFDALLDNLHGKGKFNGVPDKTPSAAKKPAKPAAKPATDTNKQPAQAAKPAAAVKPAAEKEAAKEPVKDKAAAAQAETTVRVDTKRLDDIMNMVGELVLVRNRIDRLGSSLGNEELQKAVANLDLVTTDLQNSVMKTRMQPVKKVFGRFPRVVRDLSRSLKKEIRLELVGEETELDKNVVDALADPLVHLVRNAVDHGIEMPDVREKAGKSREGTVVLSAEQEGDHILLKIEDDGGGMDAEVLKKIAIKKGVLDADTAARMDNFEAYNLIFAPGFSTKEEISDISGRGVGMDVVKTRIAQMNGTVEIDSELGKGSVLTIKLPLTLAIMPTLMVQIEQQLFALPLVNVNEILHLDFCKTNIVDGQLCTTVRNRTLPLFYLRRWLVRGHADAEIPKEGHVVVVHIGNQKVGFIVDELIGQEEVVIKPLGALLHGTSGLAGATITGDGAIAIILDIPGLMITYARHAA